MQLDEPAWISVDSTNHAVYEALNAFFADASRNSVDAQDLVDSTVHKLTSLGTQDPGVEQYKSESRTCFGILFTVVKQLDALAVQQDYFVQLILSLRNVPLPARVAREMDPYDLDDNMAQGLRMLINVLLGFEHDAPLHPRLEIRPGSGIQSHHSNAHHGG